MVLFPTPTPSNLFRMTLLKNYFLIVECIALINKLLKTNLTRNTRLCKMLWMTVLLLVITIILVKKSWDTKTDVFDIWIILLWIQLNLLILTQLFWTQTHFPWIFPCFFQSFTIGCFKLGYFKLLLFQTDFCFLWPKINPVYFKL